MDDAASWAEGSYEVSKIIGLPDPTKMQVIKLKALLTEKYPAKVADAPTFNFDTKISELRQKPDETL